MKQLNIFLLAFLLMPFGSSFARLSESDKQMIPSLSILDNAGFENGLAKWTNVGGTFELETINPISGNASGKFTGSTAGNTLCSDLKLSQNIYDGRAGQVEIPYTGGGSNYIAYVKDGNGVKQSVDTSMPAHTGSGYELVFFQFPASSATETARKLQICIEHTGASASPTMVIDNVVMGPLQGGTSIPTLSKGSILTSDGTANGEFTACPDNQPLVFDSSEPSGVKCATTGVQVLGNGGNVPHDCVTRTTANTTGSTDLYSQCSAGEIVVGGGCQDDGRTLNLSSPYSTNKWRCRRTTSGTNFISFAVCCTY